MPCTTTTYIPILDFKFNTFPATNIFVISTSRTKKAVASRLFFFFFYNSTLPFFLSGLPQPPPQLPSGGAALGGAGWGDHYWLLALPRGIGTPSPITVGMSLHPSWAILKCINKCSKDILLSSSLTPWFVISEPLKFSQFVMFPGICACVFVIR